MLDVAKGIPCHSGNFLRSLRNAHEATALGLILPDQNAGNDIRKKTNFISLIQVFYFLFYYYFYVCFIWAKIISPYFNIIIIILKITILYLLKKFNF